VTYRVRWEIEPGSAGKREAWRLTGALAGLDARGVRPRGDKLARAWPLAAQAQAGNVKLVRGAWNEAFLLHMHHQPDIAHDDIMDAASGAFDDLAAGDGVRYVALPESWR
jgi:predicted phage terminase large subunit-like protein